MATETVTVRMSRTSSDIPWGFRLQGGNEFGTALTIGKVASNSLADRAGLLEGDYVYQIGPRHAERFHHKDAQDAIVSCGNYLDLIVQRTGSTIWRPTITPVEIPALTNLAINDFPSAVPPPPASYQPPTIPGVKYSLEHDQKPISHIGAEFNTAPKPFSSSGAGYRPSQTQPAPDGYGPGAYNPPAAYPPTQLPPALNTQYNPPQPQPSAYSPRARSAQEYLEQTGGLFGTDPYLQKQKEEPKFLKSQALRMIQEENDQKTRGGYHAEPQQLDGDAIQSDSFRRLTRAMDVEGIIQQEPKGTPGGVPICESCGKKIIGVFCKAGGKTLHADCFSCSTCGNSLKNAGYFLVNNKLYCETHARQHQNLFKPAAPIDPDAFYKTPKPDVVHRPAHSPKTSYQPNVLHKGPVTGGSYSPQQQQQKPVAYPAAAVGVENRNVFQQSNTTVTGGYTGSAPHPPYANNGVGPAQHDAPRYTSSYSSTTSRLSPALDPTGKVDYSTQLPGLFSDSSIGTGPGPGFGSNGTIGYGLLPPAYHSGPEFHRSTPPYLDQSLLAPQPYSNQRVIVTNPNSLTHGVTKRLFVWPPEKGSNTTDDLERRLYRRHDEFDPLFQKSKQYEKMIQHKMQEERRQGDKSHRQHDKSHREYDKSQLSWAPGSVTYGVLSPAGLGHQRSQSLTEQPISGFDFRSRDVDDSMQIWQRPLQDIISGSSSYSTAPRSAAIGAPYYSLPSTQQQPLNYPIAANSGSHVTNQSSSPSSGDILSKQDIETLFAGLRANVERRKDEQARAVAAVQPVPRMDPITIKLEPEEGQTLTRVALKQSEDQLSPVSSGGGGFSPTSPLRPTWPSSKADSRRSRKNATPFSQLLSPSAPSQFSYSGTFMASLPSKTDQLGDRHVIWPPKSDQSGLSSIASSLVNATLDKVQQELSISSTMQHEYAIPGRRIPRTDSCQNRPNSVSMIRQAPQPAPKPSNGSKVGPASQAPWRGRGVLKTLHDGPRVPSCETCRREIRGPFILANNKTWCPDHFVCGNSQCHRKLQDVGFVQEGPNNYCEYCFERYFAPTCANCQRPVTGDCLNALQRQWHPECFTCTYCHKAFGNSSFFLEDGKPYCETDWNALFTTKCDSCQFPIEAGDKWVEALGKAFHSNCFACSTCYKNLEGQSFYAKGGKPYCKAHA